ncbi:MAG: MATE family efflux transporter [Candidatus Methanomethylophilaceae archaeon]|jgi:putative MATE family efflux protein
MIPGAVSLAGSSSENLFGDPKRAVIRMSLPIALALLVQYLNSVVDMFWVSGLGADHIAAVSVTAPIYSAIVSIGTGIGIGASYAISKRIGGRDAESAVRASSQAFVMMIIAGIITIPILCLTIGPMINYMGAADISDLCNAYIYPIILTSPLLMAGGLLAGNLRGEGAATRAMVVLSVAAVLNMILDPIFIFTLGFGIAGAAYATVISAAVSMIPAIYWYSIKKDVAVPIILKKFRFTGNEVRSISEVGIPQTAELMFMSLISVVFVRYIAFAGGTDLVAVFEIAWRIAIILMVPAHAISIAFVPMLSVSFGMKNLKRVKEILIIGFKISLSVMIVLAVITYFTAPYMAQIMTLSEDSARLRGPIAEMLKVCTLTFPAFTLVHSSAALLQSMGRGMTSLLVTVVRNLSIAVVYAVISVEQVASHMWWGFTLTEVVFGFVGITVAMTAFKVYGRKHGMKFS